MIVIAEDSVRFAHSAPSTQSTSSRYCGTRILRALLPSPREREGPSDISYRVAKRSSDRSSARGPCPQVLQWHPRVAKRASIGTSAREPSTEALLGQDGVSKERESVPLTGLWSGSRPGLARHPRLQVVLRHPGVAKGTSIGTSARQPYQQAPQWHPLGATVSWCIG